MKIAQYFDSNPSQLAGWNMHVNDSNKLTAAGNAIRRIYTDGLLQNHLGKTVSVSSTNKVVINQFLCIKNCFLQYFSDMCFSKSIIHHAKLHSKFSDVYLYIFSYSGPLGAGTHHIFYDGKKFVSQ